jgi:putative flippase GtrA
VSSIASSPWPERAANTLRGHSADRDRCAALTVDANSLGEIGAPDRIRTCDLCLRRATLYPTELRVLGSREPRPNAPNCNAAAIEPNIRSQKPEINTRWVAMFAPRRIRYLELPFSRKFSMVRRRGVREQGLAAKLEALRTTFLRNDAVRFVMVGSLFFAIDAAILAALVHGGALESVPRARRCHDHSSPLRLANSSALDLRVRPCETSHLQSLLYTTFQAISLSANYGIFSALVLTGGLWRSFPVLAAAVGSLIAAVLSYVLLKWIGFAEPREVSATEGA